MKSLTKFVLELVCAAACATACAGAMADPRQACESAAGSYLSGQVVKGPKFSHGQFRQGVELSHTHLKVRADQDGRVYDVAIDNVFANGYRQEQRGVPAPLDAIREGDRLQLCGQRYERGVGIHFVHTNCGAASSANRPDGWIKVVDAHGAAGPNLEAGTGFCGLFQHGRRQVPRR